MNIALMFGSKSVEHEISILTMVNVYNKLKDKFRVSLVYIDKDLTMYYFDKFNIEQFKNPEKIIKLGEQVNIKKGGYIGKRKIDMFIPLVHGTYGEDGRIQGYLDMLDCNYLSNTMYSSFIGHNKYLTKLILKDHNIDVLDYIRVHKDSYFDNLNEINEKVNNMGYPVILKGTSLGSSVGVTIVNSDIELEGKILDIFKYDKELIIEPFIKDFMEVNQAVVKGDNLRLSKVELVNNTNNVYSYNDKYNAYTKYKFTELTDLELVRRIRELSRKVYRILNFKSIVRIDYLIKDNIIYVNEINVIPGSLSTHLFDEELYELLKDCFYTTRDVSTYEYIDKIELNKVKGSKFE